MRNRFGMGRVRDLRTVFLGIAMALGALVMLAQQGAAQNAAEDAEQRVFTLFGSVVDAESGKLLAGAWVGLTGTDWGSISNDEGRFRVPDQQVGDLDLTIEMIGYEKLEWTGRISGPDDQVVIELEPQAIVLEGLQVVTDRFRSRRNAAATSVFAYAPEDLGSSTAQNALEFIEFNSAAWLTPCNGRQSDQCLFVRGRTVEPTVYVDERPILGGLGYLEAFAPWEFHMIEVFAGGRHIRAYTPAYMERAAKGRISPIALPF